MTENKLNILKRIKESKLRQVVLIENFIYYCENHKDFLSKKEGKQQLKELIEILK